MVEKGLLISHQTGMVLKRLHAQTKLLTNSNRLAKETKTCRRKSLCSKLVDAMKRNENYNETQERQYRIERVGFMNSL